MNKYLLLVILVFILLSCGKKHKIEGIYFVNNDKSDKVYIEKIDKNKYHIYTPGTWNEVATIKNKKLSGDWKYPDDYFKKEEAGLLGKHEGTYHKKQKQLKLLIKKLKKKGYKFKTLNDFT